MQARMVIFGMHIDDALLYPGIENQSSPAYSSLYLSNYLSFHTLRDEIFVKDFSTTMQARILIFHMQVDDDLLYRGIGTQPSPAYFSLYLSNFLSIHTLKNDNFFYHGIEDHPSPAYFSCICPFFFPSLLGIMRFFNTDFSATMQTGIIIFAILVHSCCTLSLRVSLLLLILPYI